MRVGDILLTAITVVQNKFNFYGPNSAFCSYSDKQYLRASFWEPSGLTFGLGVVRHLKTFIPHRV